MHHRITEYTSQDTEYTSQGKKDTSQYYRRYITIYRIYITLFRKHGKNKLKVRKSTVKLMLYELIDL